MAKEQDAVEEAARRMRADQERGYIGTRIDETPEAAYSVQGVIAGQPTPETDHATALEAVKAGKLPAGVLQRLPE